MSKYVYLIIFLDFKTRCLVSMKIVFVKYVNSKNTLNNSIFNENKFTINIKNQSIFVLKLCYIKRL